MKNMPSVMKEMPIAATRPAAGKRIQHERQLPVADGERDFSASAANPNSPETFHRLLQKNLHGQDRGSASEPSPGGDRQVEDCDIMKAQTTRTGTEVHTTAGEETLDSERLITTPEVRGTAKKKTSKEHSPVGAANFIISSGNIALVNKSGDPSPETSADSQQRSDGHRGVGEKLKITTAGAAPSPLKTDFGKRAFRTVTAEEVSSEQSDLVAATADTAPRVAGSDAAEMLHSQRGRRDASGKVEERFRLNNRHVGKEAAFTKTGAGSGGSVVTEGTGVSGNSVPLNEVDDSILTARSGKSRQDGGGRGAAAGVAHSPFEMGFGEHTQGMATTEKASSPPTALGAQPGDTMSIALASDAAEEIPLDPGHDGKEVAFAETGAAGSTRVVRGEKGAPLPNAFATQAADAALGEAESDDVEEIRSRRERQDASGKTERPVRLNHRRVGKETAFVGTGAGSGGSAATVEAGGTDKMETTGAFGDPTRAGGSGKSRQDNGDSGAASGIASPSLRTGPAERVHLPVTGEKVAPLPGAFAAAVGDTIAPGSDTGDEILAAGRPTVLMTQIIEAAQPLMQRGGGRILISLNPPSLGALDIDVRVKRDNVELFVIANNQDVQQTLCSHVEQLRKALVDQGLNMDRFQVVVGDRSADQQGRDPRQEGMTGGHGEARSEGGYRPERDGDTTIDEMGKAVRSDSYPSAGGINLFI